MNHSPASVNVIAPVPPSQVVVPSPSRPVVSSTPVYVPNSSWSPAVVVSHQPVPTRSPPTVVVLPRPFSSTVVYSSGMKFTASATTQPPRKSIPVISPPPATPRVFSGFEVDELSSSSSDDDDDGMYHGDGTDEQLWSMEEDMQLMTLLSSMAGQAIS